ncbi:MAG: DMT family transporter [Isosphaeraceae bacterium]
MGRGIAIPIALACGMALALQVGVNATLRSRMGGAVPAALASFATGTVALLIYLGIRPPGRIDWSGLSQAPWWIWTGGLLGAVYVATAAEVAPKLGAAPWLALIVTGQVIASILLDHFGVAGFPTHPMNWARLIGAILLLAGVVVVVRS